MRDWKSFLGATGILVATTIGAGMFSLPYLFGKSGWLAGIFYLLALGGMVTFAHYLYWLALERVNEKQRLLGLVKAHLGALAFYPAILSILGGLTLVLVIYLILAGQFLKPILSAAGASGIFGFWALASLPLFLRIRRFAIAESLGAILMAGIVFLVFFTSDLRRVSGLATVHLENLFLPFGAILFSLTGWTAIEPMFELRNKGGLWKPFSALALGTFISAFAYILFILGIFGSTNAMAPDTISGLGDWPAWKLQLLGWLGLFAIWTSYVPIARELKNSLESDLRVPASWSFGVVLFLPLILVFSGFFSFLGAIGLAGGIFLALQYVFIALVSKKILGPSPVKKFLLNILVAVFLLAAVYEFYYFVVR
ncbi:MAG: hypothetical protein HY433_00495 [Candidatus Liptonbacteria bacterium]|nr:hypothetical protein [Candidatus Liptonbacteria bacterium]